MDGVQDPGAFYAVQQVLPAPDAIADAYWRLHTQDPTTWTMELDLRPSVESF